MNTEETTIPVGAGKRAPAYDISILGPYLETYAAKPVRKRARLFISVTIFLSFLALLTIGLLQAYLAFTRYGPAAASSWSSPWLLGSLVIFVLWIFLFIRFSRSQVRSIKVYKNGVVVEDHPFLALHNRQRAILWDHFLGIAVEVRPGSSQDKLWHKVDLFLKPGKRLILAEATNGIERLPELISHIKENVYPRLLPNFRSSLQSGKWIVFGPVSIHLHEICIQHRHQSRTYPWNNVKQIDIRSGKLVVELDLNDQRTAQYAFPVVKIPNLDLLFQLIREEIEA